MKWSLYALLIGFVIDLILGDPRRIPHPIILIGKLIAAMEKIVRKIFPSTPRGERIAGLCLWIVTAGLSTVIPALLLWVCKGISPWLRLAVESVMCWQILATRSLKKESMKVYYALRTGNLDRSRQAVSMIVGRDTQSLDEKGIIRATVETIAENTSDGIIAPIFYMAIGGAAFGFFYKAINTMDSMLGYTDPPYTHLGFYPAKADDVMNFIPARLSAFFLLGGAWILKQLNRLAQCINLPVKKMPRLRIKNGWKIFKRDRYKHASPNSAQTESVVAGLLGVRLAGDAWYHGVLHKKKYIGVPLREIRLSDIDTTCKLMYAAAILALIVCCVVKALFV